MSTPPPKPDPYESPTTQTPPVRSDELTADDRNMAMLAHLLGALLGILGPLIIWLIKKDESQFVNHQGKEAVNFHLTLLIIWVVCAAVTGISCGFLFFVMAVPAILQIIFGIIAAMESTKGIWYRYPMTIRMIS